MVVISLELVAICVYFGIETARLNKEERLSLNARWVDSFGWSFFSLSLVLFLCVFFLLNRICKKQK